MDRLNRLGLTLPADVLMGLPSDLPPEYLAAYIQRLRQAAAVSYSYELPLAAAATAHAPRYAGANLYGRGQDAGGLSHVVSGIPQVPVGGSDMDVYGSSPLLRRILLENQGLMEHGDEIDQDADTNEEDEEEANNDDKKTSKSSRSKLPKGMPKRPLSAYNIFFKEERSKILEDIPSPPGFHTSANFEDAGDIDKEESSCMERRRRTPLRPGHMKDTSVDKKRQPHGKIGFETLAKTIGSRWKCLDNDRLAHYKALAKEDMARYKSEMETYHKKEAEKKEEEERLIEKKNKEEEEMAKAQEEELMKELERQNARKRKIEALLDEEHMAQCEPKIEKKCEDFSRSYLKRRRVNANNDKPATGTKNETSASVTSNSETTGTKNDIPISEEALTNMKLLQMIDERKKAELSMQSLMAQQVTPSVLASQMDQASRAEAYLRLVGLTQGAGLYEPQQVVHLPSYAAAAAALSGQNASLARSDLHRFGYNGHHLHRLQMSQMSKNEDSAADSNALH